jgi:methylenetetrahydrofolate reductase (NADPH)
MSTVKEKILLLKPNQRFVSFEFFPPKTDGGFRNLLARLNRMSALNPLFITVTWGAGGSTSEKSLELAATCQKDLGLTTVLHLTCTNTNKQIIDEALDSAKKNGIRNILALRGDPPRTEEYWTPDCDFVNAVDLVKYIKANHGDYFCIGVAGYPEGHVEGSDRSGQDPKKDMPYLIEKVEAGAEFIITQLFFDTDKFLHYESLLRSYPQLENTILIPGLMPITTYKVFTRATRLSHATVPSEIESKLNLFLSDDDHVKNIGVDIVSGIIEKINSKVGNRIKGFHFYCLNLEKASASIIETSSVLRPILDEVNSNNDNEDAIASDSDGDILPVNGTVIPKRRMSAGISPQELTKRLVTSRALQDKKAIRGISTGKDLTIKDAIWDDFPNGRFSDSNSPAYGEIDGYGPSLKISSPEEAASKWGTPEKVEDITKVFINYLSGKTELLPWVDQPLSPETALIQEQLFELNSKGWFSLASQPAINGCKSSDKILGWGPNGGVLYQKAFVELFIPKDEWKNKVLPSIQQLITDKTITYFAGESTGNVTSNLRIGNDRNTKNAVTWGIFPMKEVLQPTIIDYESFKAWNEEAFHLWVEWARCYKKNSKTYELLNSINDNYVLVSIIHHDFQDEFGLWNILLGQ